ncbi:MAG: hypothetical protein ACYCOY_08525 [Metallibacterium sp.]
MWRVSPEYAQAAPQRFSADQGCPKHQAQHVSRTFVLTDSAEPKRILGYYTLSN